MGSARTVAEFTRNIDQLGRRIAAPDRVAARDAAEVFGEIIDREADRKGATSWADKKRPTYRVGKVTSKGETIIRPGNVGAIVALNSGTDPHFVGARRSAVARGVRDRGLAAARQVGLDTTGLRRVRGGAGKQALWWTGAQHPTPYARVGGTSGFGFIRAATRYAPERAAEVWLASKRRELLKGGR